MTDASNPEAAADAALGAFLALAMTRSGVNAAGEWLDEVGRFSSRRLVTDANYLSALAGCVAPADAALTTARFLDEAVADYRAFARAARQAALAAPCESLKTAEDCFAPPGPLPIE
jgi:hypothetical protein